ncbi:MAG: leucyl aminopeptidase family protein [Gammaproteobacteria bacterium]|nr:leucyl aminopeptidase family protein [Gammaproteobacteria bacterium]MBU2675637.1 leucyl aminopeptidase family protein [Gammaproteobacteria bacterium]NNC56564.1 leucyl aminopeptidase family protein [Woeseiaceae bacterium]NNL49372.1 leucyl aminopeptidase family protein [Woeseiaceae bacterium]
MTTIAPDIHGIRIFQSPGRVSRKALDAVDQLLLILPARPTAADYRKIPHGSKLKAVQRKHTAGSTPAFTTRLGNKKQTLVVAGTLSSDASAFEQLTLGRKLVAAATGQKPGSIGIAAVGFSADAQARIVNSVLAATLAAGFKLPSYKSKPTPSKIRSIRLLGLDSPLDTSRCEAEARGNNLARWLTAQPPNVLDARCYTDIIRGLAKQHGWQFKRFATKELTTLGAGAFLAVAQGNDNDSAGIVRLRYRPGLKTSKPDLSLVGKGIIFDTGGTNLKPFSSMLDMHGDMQGSAVALGTFLSISELQLPIAVDCWLALTENRTGPKAYKSQDVVTAANGKTIQIVHTDAEGRMALADALVLASREQPGIIFDFATLTGTCISAITTRYSGVFTNRAELHPHLKRIGRQCGERVWPFPIGKEFLEDLKSNTADLLQCSPKGFGDHILAASFLGEFIENDTPWVHMDLSAGDNEGGLAHIGSKFTGFGVRYTMSVILDEHLFKATL